MVSLRHGWARSRFAAGLGAVAVAGLGLRVLYIQLFTRHLEFGLDALWYRLVAGTVASGVGYVDPGLFYSQQGAFPTAFRPPLYPLFLAGLAKAGGGTLRWQQLVGALAGTVTVVLVGLLGRRLAGPAVGLVAAAMAAAYPVLLAVDASVMSETIYVPLVVALLLLVYRALDRPTPLRWVAVGLVGGACVLARGDGVALVAAVVVPVALLARGLPLRRRALLGACAVLAVAVVVSPWLIRNQARLGEPTLATLDTGTAIAGTNCATTYHGPRLGSWDHECTVRADADRPDEVTLTRRLQRQGARYALDNAARLPVVVPVRVLRLWGLWDPVGEARLEAPESRNVRWQLLSWGTFLPVAGLGAYGLVLLGRRSVPIVPLLAVLAAVTVTAALTYGKQRFRVSAEPVLLVAAATALVQLVNRLGVRGRPRQTRARRG